MTTERLDVVSRDEHGTLHRRFRAADGALVGTRACPAVEGEMQLGADPLWVLGDVDPDALCDRCRWTVMA